MRSLPRLTETKGVGPSEKRGVKRVPLSPVGSKNTGGSDEPRRSGPLNVSSRKFLAVPIRKSRLT